MVLVTGTVPTKTLDVFSTGTSALATVTVDLLAVDHE